MGMDPRSLMTKFDTQTSSFCHLSINCDIFAAHRCQGRHHRNPIQFLGFSSYRTTRLHSWGCDNTNSAIANKSFDGRLTLEQRFHGSFSGLRIQGKHCHVTAKAWPKERNGGLSASVEQSENANEELLLFFFQLDLTTRLQRALNLDQYEAAQQIREKLVEVDNEISKQKEARLGSAASKEEAQDKAIIILRLKNDMQKAIEEEDYGGAAELRDQISKLEAESLAAAAKALAYENVQYAFRLGQKVRHAKFGYRGVICGMDPLCSESESWSATSIVKSLSRGRNQPFYQVLVDMRTQPDLLVTYVAEENLLLPQQPDKDRFDHPYISFLFYGMDSAGDFIPIKQLREKYNKPRHELPWEGGENGPEDGAKP